MLFLKDITQLIIQHTLEGKIDKKVSAEILSKILKQKDVQKSNDIAIIGIAAKLPMADNINEFWENVKTGKDCITDYPVERINDTEKLIVHNTGINNDQNIYNQGGYLKEIDKFDHNFFDITPKEASLMDPNQRLFLETVWSVIEDAGYSGNKIKSTNTGIFVGHSSWPIYQSYIIKAQPESVGMAIAGNLSSIIASRISYVLDLKGPSMVIDTACSSSLTAVHMACQNIKNGECEQAIAGGVRINFMPVQGLYEVGIESKSQRVHAFDDSADGTVFGEGVAAVFLKPLDKALEDKDNIYAVIKGSAISQNGTSSGITAPHAPAQEEAIINAWKQANIDPKTIKYIEAFGSGTPLGDSIELTAISKAFRKYVDDKQFCAIGSVKSNIGHLDSAAGMAGLIKAVLALKYKQIPPTINYQKPNRTINFNQSPVYVNTKLLDWEPSNIPRRCGVNAYSFSGNNCHVVLEESPIQQAEATKLEAENYYALTISAKTKEALLTLVEQYKSYIQAKSSKLEDICYTACTGREHYQHRLVLIVQSLDELEYKLNTINNLTIDDIKEKEVYYNVHKIVKSNVDKNKCEITERDKLQLNKKAKEVIELYDKTQNQSLNILQQLCQLYVNGADIQWEKWNESTYKANLPTYPFERTRCWVECDAEKNKQLANIEINHYLDIQKYVMQGWADTLGYNIISVQDNFFDMGGNSISAIKASNNLSELVQKNIPYTQIFNYPTVEAYAQWINKEYFNFKENFKYKESIDLYTITPAEKKEQYEVSSAQKRLLILNELDPQSTNYNMPFAYTIEGKLDKVKLESAFNETISQQEVLRTSFCLIDGKFYQRVHKNIDFKINYVDIEEDKAEEYLNSLVKPFDLSKAPLLRAYILRISEEKHILFMDMHHAISDGTSMSIVAKEFIRLYSGQQLKPLKIQYKDFAEWQNKLLGGEEIKKQEEYWTSVFDRTSFQEEIPVLNMPIDYPRPAVQSFEGANVSFNIDESLTEKLRQLTKQTGTTMYMLLLGAYNVLLSKYTGQEDIVVGTPIAGRGHADLQEIIGMFINTLVMRNQPKGEISFAEFLKTVKEHALSAYENQDYQFEELIEKLDIEREMSRNPLFDVMFVLQNMEATELEIEGLSFKPYEYENRVSKFDMTLTAVENNNRINFNLEYCTKLFKEETIQRIVEHFKNLLSSIVDNPEQKIADTNILSEQEREQILVEFNNTKADYSRDKTIQQLFEEQVEKAPDNIAVVYEDKHLTYRELNEKANQLARVLRNKGIGRENIVGLFVERSIEMVIGMLAVIKSGAAYVPIDMGYPQERIEFIIEDSKISILLSKSDLVQRVNFDGEIIKLDDVKIYEQIETSNVENTSKAEDLAYIIYTSGTTGNPKGVMINHGSMSQTIQWRKNEYGIGERDKVLQLFSYSFDGFVTSFYTPIVSGAKVVLLNEEQAKDPLEIKKHVVLEKVTHFISVPVLYKAILECCYTKELKDLRIVTLGGEKITSDIIALNKEKNHNIEIVNEYGPTEGTVVATCQRNINTEDAITIGKPVSNTSIYILDKNNNIKPIGILGEICIGGERLAKGYVNRPELTSEKFIVNPFKVDERIYKTGDLGKWLPDGRVVFLGRKDYQAKIRGYRIELGEIESKLLKINGVKETVTLVRDDSNSNNYICAYYVSEQTITVQEFREYLSKDLPEYMIPSYFIQLDSIPLTPNGKIDKNALPEPDGSILMGTEYEAPTNEIEEKLVEIWQEVLGVERVGINDNFFELGGHSLKGTVLVSKIYKELNTEISLKEVFKRPIIKELAEYINNSKESIYSSIVPVKLSLINDVKEYYPLSSAQKRLYILDQLERTGISYNMPALMTVEGKLDKDRVEMVLARIIQRHESLRTSFEILEGEPVQKINDKVKFEVEYIETNKADVEEIAKDFVKPFDLSQAPLMRVRLARIEENKHFMMFDMHHIISDGTSMSLFIREFVQLYKGAEVLALKIQYKDFAEWQNKLLSGVEIKKQEQYWLDTFKGELPVLNMPLDYVRPSVQSFEGTNIEFDINESLTEKLRQLSRETETTMYILLLGVYNVLLSKCTGQEDIIVGSPIAGRGHADLQGIIGMFVNTLAMRNQPKGEMSFVEFLQTVKEGALLAYENQDYQFEELLEKLDLERDMSRNPLFDVMFSLQNMETTELEIEGLVFKPYEYESTISKFDMSLIAKEVHNRINFKIEYRISLFREQTIKYLMEEYIRLINQLVLNPNMKLKDYIIFSARCINVQNNMIEPKCKYENFSEMELNKSVIKRFEEQVEKNRDSIAVKSGKSILTYDELNKKAGYIANSILSAYKQKGNTRNHLGKTVAMLFEHGVDMIASTIGVLKTGGIYVPLDATYPIERLNYIINNSEAEIIITNNNNIDLAKELFDNKTDIINIDTIESRFSEVLDVEIDPQQPAYILYTSGSMGKPKGVVQSHSNIMNFIAKYTNQLHINDADRLALLTSYSHTVSAIDTFSAILNGAQLHIYDIKGNGGIDGLAQWLKEEEITIYHSIPTLYRYCMDVLEEAEVLPNIRLIVLGGEAVSKKDVEIYKKHFNEECILVNLFGSSEIILASSNLINRDTKIASTTVPVGYPIESVNIYILNEDGEEAGVYEYGELVFESNYLSDGYWRMREKTQEVFGKNPITGQGRVYRSGDIGRLMPDGCIEYIGRKDFQVKIRGYRVELGEIEAVLDQINGVKKSVAAAFKDEDNENYLVAYYETKDSIEMEASKLKNILKDELPDYMVPLYFIHMEQLPQTPNGKIDRKLLIKPEGTANIDIEYKAPENDIEERLAELWKNLLNIERVGVNDNFFNLGGHSLKATMLASRIYKEFNVELLLKDIFSKPGLKEMADCISIAEKKNYSSIPVASNKKHYPLTSAQKRIFRLNNVCDSGVSFNTPGAVILEGVIDRKRLESAFIKLVKRYDSFRLSFKIENGEPVQILHEEVDLNMEYIEAYETEIENIRNKFIREFDLTKAPLFRVGLVRLSPQKHLLIYDMHHIISDGTSEVIFRKEIFKLYKGEILPGIKVGFLDFAEWQNKRYNSNDIDKQSQYWSNVFREPIANLNMPVDFVVSETPSFETNTLTCYISDKTIENINTFIMKHDITINTVFFSMYALLLNKYTGQDDIVIGTVVAGRNHPDLESIIGDFTYSIPIRIKVEGHKTLLEFICYVHSILVEAYDNQDYPFDRLIHQPIINNEKFTMLNFHSEIGQTIDLNIDGINFSGVDIRKNSSNLDLKIDIYLKDRGAICNLEYNISLFKHEKMECFNEKYKQLIGNVVQNINSKISQILGDREKQLE